MLLLFQFKIWVHFSDSQADRKPFLKKGTKSPKTAFLGVFYDFLKCSGTVF